MFDMFRRPRLCLSLLRRPQNPIVGWSFSSSVGLTLSSSMFFSQSVLAITMKVRFPLFFFVPVNWIPSIRIGIFVSMMRFDSIYLLDPVYLLPLSILLHRMCFIVYSFVVVQGHNVVVIQRAVREWEVCIFVCLCLSPMFVYLITSYEFHLIVVCSCSDSRPRCYSKSRDKKRDMYLSMSLIQCLFWSNQFTELMVFVGTPWREEERRIYSVSGLLKLHKRRCSYIG